MTHLSPINEYYSQESERLAFRPFTDQDFKKWIPFFNDNPTLEFLGLSQLDKAPADETSQTWINRQIERQQNKEYGQLAVIEKSSGKFIGVGGIIARIIEGKTEYEITYSFLQTHWGKGYATELAKHFNAFALKHITPSPISIIHVNNTASMRVAEKNGMKADFEMSFMNMPVCIYRYEG